MRFTGSFHTIVTHGVSGATSSLISGRSTSAGATLTGHHLLVCRLPPSLPARRRALAPSSTSGPAKIAAREVQKTRRLLERYTHHDQVRQPRQPGATTLAGPIGRRSHGAYRRSLSGPGHNSLGSKYSPSSSTSATTPAALAAPSPKPCSAHHGPRQATRL